MAYQIKIKLYSMIEQHSKIIELEDKRERGLRHRLIGNIIAYSATNLATCGALSPCSVHALSLPCARTVAMPVDGICGDVLGYREDELAVDHIDDHNVDRRDPGLAGELDAFGCVHKVLVMGWLVWCMAA